MKRSTFSLLMAGVILLGGGMLLWFLLVAPRLQPAPAASPVSQPWPAPATEERHAVLNAYLTAPEALPEGVARMELTLAKATVSGDGRTDVPVFEGARRIEIQPGTVEKALSETIPTGRWNRLTLTFSPAADISMSDGTAATALLERKTAVFSFNTDLPTSRSLALLGRLPLERALGRAGAAVTANLLPDAQKTESYVFGSSMLDPRGVTGLWTLPKVTLSAVIKAELGFDITVKLPGSQGFSPAEQEPSPKAS